LKEHLEVEASDKILLISAAKVCLNYEYGKSIKMPQYLSRVGVTMSIFNAFWIVEQGI